MVIDGINISRMLDNHISNVRTIGKIIIIIDIEIRKINKTNKTNKIYLDKQKIDGVQELIELPVFYFLRIILNTLPRAFRI